MRGKVLAAQHVLVFLKNAFSLPLEAVLAAQNPPFFYTEFLLSLAAQGQRLSFDLFSF
jgi:hypothetical protein